MDSSNRVGAMGMLNIRGSRRPEWGAACLVEMRILDSAEIPPTGRAHGATRA